MLFFVLDPVQRFMKEGMVKQKKFAPLRAPPVAAAGPAQAYTMIQSSPNSMIGTPTPRSPSESPSKTPFGSPPRGVNPSPSPKSPSAGPGSGPGPSKGLPVQGQQPSPSRVSPVKPMAGGIGRLGRAALEPQGSGSSLASASSGVSSSGGSTAALLAGA